MLKVILVYISITRNHIFICFQNCYEKKVCKSKISEELKRIKEQDSRMEKKESIANQCTLFIRTSKFCLRLTVLNFLSFLRLKCCEFVPISLTEPCNTTKKNVRLSTIKTLYFISFFFLQAADIGSHWEVVYKKSVLQL